MATTVGELLRRIAIDLHESSPDFSGSELWTTAEMLGFVGYAEKDFLRRTGIYKLDLSFTVGSGSRLIARPAGIMDIERVSFNKVRLRLMSGWDLERGDAHWRAKRGLPHYYHEDHTPIDYFELDRITDRTGTIRIFGDLLPSDPLTLDQELTVRDAWVPYIQWGALALSLGKDGDGQDLVRAAYAQQRYAMGVGLAKRLVFGDIPIALPGKVA